MRFGDMITMGRSLRLSYQCGLQVKCLNNNFINQQMFRRQYSSDPKIKIPDKLKSKITSAYINHLDKFDDTLKTKWPKAHKLFRLFKDGIREFFKDFKEYYNVSMSIRSGVSLANIKCQQLQLYQQMPSDLVKSVPIVLSIPVPFGTYIIFPIAYYMYPQYLLCSHFWTDEQKKIFGVGDLEYRLDHYSKVFQYLEGHLSYINDSYTKNDFQNLLVKVKQGKVDIEPEELMKFKHLFTTLPFGIDHLLERKKIHMRHLSKVLNVSSSKAKIAQDLKLIVGIDAALYKEGFEGIKKNSLYQIALLRGINPYEVSGEELKNYLKKWIEVSRNVDESSYSLLLHAPVFLSPKWMKKLKIPQI